MIDIFDGTYSFLSNFYERDITVEGITYKSSEAAYQAYKLTNREERLQFMNLNASAAKRLGRSIKLRSDWEEKKEVFMKLILLMKFNQHKDLQEKLLATGDEYLEEGNTWHDNYWGNCHCNNCKDIKGQNNLGKILMEVREFFKERRECDNS